MTTYYIVKFSKWFMAEHLSGLIFDDSLTFTSLEQACNYVNFCHAHRDEPVMSLDGLAYTIHLARIETFQLTTNLNKEF